MRKHRLRILYGLAVSLAFACVTASCSADEGGEAIHAAALDAIEPYGQQAAFDAATSVLSSGFDAALPVDSLEQLKHAKLMAILSPDDTIWYQNRYVAHYDSMPPGGIKMKINGLGGTLGRVFNDSNKYHIASAEQNGIEPLYSIGQAWDEARKLERLETCEAYYLDELTHSMPYLVPKAHRLLKDIGIAFRDSLEARGGGYYRIKVTSVLRTPSLIKRLRRRNRNAVDTSAHLFATTFDISYLKFICDTPSIPRTQEDMKNLLGEVIDDMRRQERCYVKYERKQACYHITVR